MKRPRLSWILALLTTVSIGFIVVKEIVDPSQIVDLKIDTVRYEDLPALTSALELFVHKHGKPPGDVEGLSALVCVQSSEMNCIPHLHKDPWLHSYVYRRVAEPPGYMVYSIGAHGVDEHGGGDDIVTWPKHYTCREYGVGCIHIVGLLEFGAFALTILCGIFFVFLGGAKLAYGVRKDLRS